MGGRERREADCRRVFRGFRRQRRRCNAPSQRDIGETPHNVCHEVNIEKLRSAGTRLGVLASADKELIGYLRKDVAIWNINSFAEFYMQIYGKYEKDYARSCDKFREERAIFAKELESVPFLRVIPSQANYFLCELTGRFSSGSWRRGFLTEHNILIKDCSAKRGSV